MIITFLNCYYSTEMNCSGCITILITHGTLPLCASLQKSTDCPCRRGLAKLWRLFKLNWPKKGVCQLAYIWQARSKCSKGNSGGASTCSQAWAHVSEVWQLTQPGLWTKPKLITCLICPSFHYMVISFPLITDLKLSTEQTANGFFHTTSWKQVRIKRIYRQTYYQLKPPPNPMSRKNNWK